MKEAEKCCALFKQNQIQLIQEIKTLGDNTSRELWVIESVIRMVVLWGFSLTIFSQTHCLV